VIAVDISETKLKWARDFGATHTVNAKQGDPVAAVREIADGVGVDFAYEAVGIPLTIEQAVASLAYAGTATHIGLPEDGQKVTLNFGNMDTGVYWNKATLKVCHCGDALPSNDFPLLAQLYLQGKLKLDEMVTARITLDEVNEAFEAMETGDVLRSVIVL
jgi:S-(hydroxymethyl)mycothiol dehydrogenase